MNTSNHLKFSYIGLILLLMYLPIVILIILSFNQSTYSMEWSGFSMHWYQELWQDQAIWLATLHSLILGSSNAICATVLGFLAAVNLYRYSFFSKSITKASLIALLIAPDIMLGISFLLLFNFLKIKLGFFSLLAAHITFCLPFVTITIYSALSSCDKNIFEAAKDLGASEFTIIIKILLPILWPALLASWLLSFTLSLDDVIISYFISGPNFEILPLKIYGLARSGIKPELNALCTVIFSVTLCLVIAFHLMLYYQRKTRKVSYEN